MEFQKIEVDLRRAKRQIEVHELAAQGKNKGLGGLLGFGGGGGDAQAQGNDEAQRWKNAAQVYATKLAEADANIKNMQMALADVNEERPTGRAGDGNSC